MKIEKLMRQTLIILTAMFSLLLINEIFSLGLGNHLVKYLSKDFRENILQISIVLSIFLVGIICFVIYQKILNKNFIEIPIPFYLIVLSIYNTFVYLANSPKVIISWPSICELLLIFKIEDQSFLQNDYLVNALFQSPKIITGYILIGLTKLLGLFSIHWESSIYLLQVFLSIIYLPMIFLLFYKIIEYWKPKDLSRKNHEYIKFFILFILMLYQLSINYFFHPAGLNSIVFFPFNDGSNGIAYSQNISRIIGFIFIIVALNNNHLFLSTLILLICSVIHPVSSIFTFSFYFLFKFPKAGLDKTDFIYFFLGILFPALIYKIYYIASDPLDSIEFIDIYVKNRHPHHFLVSHIVGFNFYMWMILLILPSIFYKGKNKSLKILFIMGFASFVTSVLFQFLSTEIIPNKLLATISPNRFTRYGAFIFIINILIFCSHDFPSSYIKNISNSFNFLNKTVYWLIKLFEKYSFLVVVKNPFFSTRFSFFLIVFFLTSFLWKFSFSSVLDKKNNSDYVNWIKHNTESDDTFMFLNGNQIRMTYLTRIWGERSVFWDKTFPPNENYYRRFIQREKLTKISKIDRKILNKTIEKEQIDYIVCSAAEKSLFDKFQPLFSTENISVYDSYQLIE